VAGVVRFGLGADRGAVAADFHLGNGAY